MISPLPTPKGTEKLRRVTISGKIQPPSSKDAGVHGTNRAIYGQQEHSPPPPPCTQALPRRNPTEHLQLSLLQLCVYCFLMGKASHLGWICSGPC